MSENQNHKAVAELLARTGRVQTVLSRFDNPLTTAEKMARGATAVHRQFLRLGEAAGFDTQELKARLADFLREFRALTGIQHSAGRVLGDNRRTPDGFKSARVSVQAETGLVERFQAMTLEQRAEVLRRGLSLPD